MVEHFKVVPGRTRLSGALRVLSAVVDANDPAFSYPLRCSTRAKGPSEVWPGLEPGATPLGIRRNRQGKYPAPTQPTFCRLLQRVDARKVEQVIMAIQQQMRGPAPKDQLIVLDGKEPKRGSGADHQPRALAPGCRKLDTSEPGRPGH
jgi:hypothetical protein